MVLFKVYAFNHRIKWFVDFCSFTVLPFYFQFTEQKVRAIFDDYGSVTDCSLKYTKDGVFRQFAFIGFATEAETQNAINSLNNTYIQTSKVTVSNRPQIWIFYPLLCFCKASPLHMNLSASISSVSVWQACTIICQLLRCTITALISYSLS